MIIPAPRAVLALAASVPIAGVLLRAFPESPWSAMYLPALAATLFFLDLILAASFKDISFDARHPTHFYVGQKAEIAIAFAGPGTERAPVDLSVFWEADGPFPEIPEGRLALAETGELRLSVTPSRRGRIRPRHLWLSLLGPLKFALKRASYPLDLDLPVHQNIHALTEEALSHTTRDASFGQKSLPFLGEGGEFENLADYQVGMDNRFIDWKRSARHHRLLAKEFRTERNHQIMLAFDLGRLASEPIDSVPRLDRFVRAGLALSWIALRSGDLVGACGFDASFRSFLAPGRGPSFFAKLLNFTARLDYAPVETNFTLCLTELLGRLRQRALIVLGAEFSDSVSATLLLECLELIRKKHRVIFVSLPDPLLETLSAREPKSMTSLAESVIAQELARERALTIAKMTRLGVWAIDVPYPKLNGALLNRYLRAKERGLL
ncbi:MAG: DUF58 domain-containing protein [Deltaproteobacteria bacterium]|jgi:uncharacterized protein (DUF58 family)|nr:DUF58 domain-containing protein [Deltaproteobacteria bacterium]